MDGTGTFGAGASGAQSLQAFTIGKGPYRSYFDIYVLADDFLETEFTWATDSPQYTFPPASKVASPVEGFDRFFRPQENRPFELTVARAAAQEARWGTFGTRSSDRDLCVYAVSLQRTVFPTNAESLVFEGNVDGFLGASEVTARLYDSRARFAFDKTNNTGTLVLDLRTTDQPFGDYRSRTPAPLIRFETKVGGRFDDLSAPLASADGAWSGQVWGRVGPPFDLAASFAFVARHADGRVIFGAAALGDPSCVGCWDY